MAKGCKTPGCKGEHNARGYCARCYSRKRKRGDFDRDPPESDLLTMLKAVVDGVEIVQCKAVVDWCERSIEELGLAEAGKIPYYYDEAYAKKVIRTLETFTTKQGEPFRLYWWERIIALQFFGWKHAEGIRKGYRRFNEIVIYSAKGSGKSPFAALIGIWMTVCEKVPFAWTVVHAHDYKQTKVLFDNVGNFISLHPKTANTCQLIGKSDWRSFIHNPSRSVFERLAHQDEGLGASGPELRCVITEEGHQLESFDQREELTANFKRDKQPVAILLANAGAGTDKPMHEKIDQCKKVASGEIENMRMLPWIFEQDDGDDFWNDPSVWPKANPSLYHGQPLPDVIQNDINDTEGFPSRRAGVARRRFCIWSESTDAWIEPEKWKELEVDSIDDLIIGARSAFSIDLSWKKDLTSVGIVWILPGGKLALRVHSFTQHEGIQARIKEDKTNYYEHEKAGWLTITPGSYIGIGFPGRFIVDHCETSECNDGAFDPARIVELIDYLDTEGIVSSDRSLVEKKEKKRGRGINLYGHSQGWKTSAMGLSMPRSVDAFERLAHSNLIYVEKNFLLRGAALGARMKANEQGERYPTKTDSKSKKIDPFTAGLMAVGLADWLVRNEPSKKRDQFYDELLGDDDDPNGEDDLDDFLM